MDIVAQPTIIDSCHDNAVILSDDEEDDNDDSDVNVFHISSSNCLDDGISTNSEEDEDDKKFNLIDVDNIIINVNNVDENITYKDGINDETPIFTNHNIFNNATIIEDKSIGNVSLASANFAVKEEVFKDELPCLNALAKVELSIEGDISSLESHSHNSKNSINHCDYNYASSLALFEASDKVEHDIVVDDDKMTMESHSNTNKNNSNDNNDSTKTKSNLVTIEFDALVDCDNKSSIIKSDPTNDSCNKKEGLVNEADALQNSVSTVNIVNDNTLNENTIRETLTEEWKCEFCGIEKRSKRCLANHLRKFHGVQKPYACSLCNFRGSCETWLKVHKETHHKVKPFACKMCDFQTVTQKHLKNHIKTHTEEKPFACKKCSFRAVRQVHLRNHMLIHNQEKPFACKQCNFQAQRQVHLQNHMRACHQKLQGLLFCPTCSFSAINKRLLEAHRRSTHWRKERFNCDKCDYETWKKDHFTKHLASHEKEAKYECHMCDFKAFYKAALVRHEKSHPNEKSFTCNECDYWTAEALAFQRHMRIHMENRK